MKPFHMEAQLLQLVTPIPDASTFKEVVGTLSRHSREAVVRLWMTEGIPSAFSACPAVYEELRVWISQRLRLCPKDITLVGSARLGFSLAPQPRFGTPFDEKSDLDLCVISELLFQELVTSFQQWVSDYERGLVTPNNERERGYWDSNARIVPRNIDKGFVDEFKIPARDRYPLVREIRQVMYEVKNKLEATPGAPNPRKASMRVYRSWKDLVSQVSLNLHWALS